MKTVPLLTVSVCLSLARPFAVPAQTNAPAPLPPAAQEAMEKGLIAANQQEYLLAVRLFQDARKTAPRAPVLLFNLGLAESKIAGRELRAMTWFGAYLEASPDAANAVAVKVQIRMLDVKNQASLSRLIRTAEDAAKQFGETTRDGSSSLAIVAGLWARMGDLETAIQTADHIQADWKDVALRNVVEAQAEAGDIAGAQSTTNSIQNTFSKDIALNDIAVAQAKAGDIAGAQRTAGSIQANAKFLALKYISEAQAEAGDIAGAERTADSIQDAGLKDMALNDIAIAQAKAGDIAGAQRTAGSIQDAGWKDVALYVIATAQAKAGDIAGAQRTAGSIEKDANRKNSALAAIATAQAKAGDIAGAERTADSIQDAGWKANALKAIATAQAPTNPGNVVAQRQPAIRRWIDINDGLLNAAAFLDFGAHLKSLPSDNGKSIFVGLSDAAQIITYARQVITRMLKQQAEPRATP